MPNLSKAVRRIREDAKHSGYKLGPKSTERLIALIEALASDVDALNEESGRDSLMIGDWEIGS